MVPMTFAPLRVWLRRGQRSPTPRDFDPPYPPSKAFSGTSPVATRDRNRRSCFLDVTTEKSAMGVWRLAGGRFFYTRAVGPHGSRFSPGLSPNIR
jgi:hypothetical protein